MPGFYTAPWRKHSSCLQGRVHATRKTWSRANELGKGMEKQKYSPVTRPSAKCIWPVPKRQDRLRQRISGTVFRQCVVDVHDSGQAVEWINLHLEQVQQVPRFRRAAGAVGADHAYMVRRVDRGLILVRELDERLGFGNLSLAVVRFYNKRGTAE